MRSRPEGTAPLDSMFLGGLGRLRLLHLVELLGRRLHEGRQLRHSQVVEVFAQSFRDGGPHLVLGEALLGTQLDEPLSQVPQVRLVVVVAGNARSRHAFRSPSRGGGFPSPIAPIVRPGRHALGARRGVHRLLVSVESIPKAVSELGLLERVQSSLIEQRKTSELIIAELTQVPVQVQELSPKANIVATITPQIIFHCRRRMPGVKINNEKLNLIRKLSRQILESAIKEMGEDRFRAELKANKWRIFLDKEQIVAGSFDVPSAIMGVFILGTIVWPHESYPRYPAPPDAPEDFKQAAEQRKVGIRHYSEDLGVIYHIQELAGRAHAVAESLAKTYKLAWFS